MRIRNTMKRKAEFEQRERIMKRKLQEKDEEEFEEDGKKQAICCHGKNWVRGKMIGEGSSASVFLATPKKQTPGHFIKLPPMMVVKSAHDSDSDLIRKDAEILLEIKGSPFVIERLGEEITTSDDGDRSVYNLLLEFASGGSLGDILERSYGRGLRASDVKKYTKSILEGLKHVHKCNFVHCDLKSENILLVPGGGTHNFVAKIADFGLSKRSTEDLGYWSGSPAYLSPEALHKGEQEQPSDIWSLGCIVLEMLTGKPITELKCESRDEVVDFDDVMFFDPSCIPQIPGEISSLAKDFLKSCLAIRPEERLTAEKLLLHPFVAQPRRQPKARSARRTNLGSFRVPGIAAGV